MPSGELFGRVEQHYESDDSSSDNMDLHFSKVSVITEHSRRKFIYNLRDEGSVAFASLLKSNRVLYVKLHTSGFGRINGGFECSFMVSKENRTTGKLTNQRKNL